MVSRRVLLDKDRPVVRDSSNRRRRDRNFHRLVREMDLIQLNTL